jgi:hypothetical protein
MARLWIKDDSGEWAVLPLVPSASFYPLSANPLRALNAAGTIDSAACETVLVSSDSPDDAGWNEGGWLLLSPSRSGVLVNGLPVSAGIRLLEDGDEIRVSGSGIFYFSAERAARPETFRPDSKEASSARCPRCLRTIRDGETVVRCPRCGVLHHHLLGEGYACWTYADGCAVCGGSTSLADEPEWSPDEF